MFSFVIILVSSLFSLSVILLQPGPVRQSQLSNSSLQLPVAPQEELLVIKFLLFTQVRKMSPSTDTKAPVPVAWDSVSTISLLFMASFPMCSEGACIPASNAVNVFLLLGQVEEMLRDAITRNLQTFYGMLLSYDLGDTGTIARNNFKKVIHVFCPYLSNEHFIK